MTWVASLGMYDSPSISWANDALWDALAETLSNRGLIGVPAQLDRDRSLDTAWSDPDLLLAQCCGYPLVSSYRGKLRYVATPHYAAPGCTGGLHRSRIVVRIDDYAADLADLRGRAAALNGRDSNSGMNLFRATIAPLAAAGRFFSEVIETGSHTASLHAVAAGRADVAAIDTVSFAHAALQMPEIVASLRTIAWTPASAGLPFVTSVTTPDAVVKELQAALKEVVRGRQTRRVCDALLLKDVGQISFSAYENLKTLEQDAIRLGYPDLA